MLWCNRAALQSITVCMLLSGQSCAGCGGCKVPNVLCIHDAAVPVHFFGLWPSWYIPVLQLKGTRSSCW